MSFGKNRWPRLQKKDYKVNIYQLTKVCDELEIGPEVKAPVWITYRSFFMSTKHIYFAGREEYLS